MSHLRSILRAAAVVQTDGEVYASGRPTWERFRGRWMTKQPPTRTPSRRRVLQALGATGLSGVAGCGQLTEGFSFDSTTASSDPPTSAKSSGSNEPSPPDQLTTSQEFDVDPVDSQLLIGAYYYAWYRPGQSWLERSPSTPVLGEYSSRDEAVINQHIEWALESGINTFVCRWGGPDAWDDTTIREYLLEATLGREIDFMIQPSVGALSPDPDYTFPAPIDFDARRTREHLIALFEYLEERFFGRSNYARLDGRPAVTLFGGSAFGGDYGSAFEEAKAAVDETPYIIADMAFRLTSGWAGDGDFRGVDAVTTYTLYNAQRAEELDFDAYERYIEEQGLAWRLGADNRGVGFVPNVGPGYDDTLERPEADHRPIEPTPDRFERFIAGQRDYVDDALMAIFVTSFNEWYEDTSVEPQQEHGSEYLRIIENELASAPLEPIAVGSEFVPLRIAFNKTIESNDGHRDLALMLTQLELRDESGHPTTGYDIGVPPMEPYIVEGGYPPERDTESEWESWRWFGGPTAEAVIYLDSDAREARRMGLRGTPMVDDEISASLYFDGRHAADIDFGDRGSPTWYTVRLPAA